MVRIKCPATDDKNRLQSLEKNLKEWLFSTPMKQLLSIFGYTVDSSDDFTSDISKVLEAAEVWNQRGDGARERWNIQNGEFVERKKQEIMECMEQLGLVKVREPFFEPDYLLPLGGARYTNLTRPQEAKILLNQYQWKNKEICGLACYRKKAAIEAESWNYYCPYAANEFESMAKGMEAVFELSEDYTEDLQENENLNQQYCVRRYKKQYYDSTCGCLAAPSKNPMRRANTYETVEFFLEKYNVQKGKKLLFTTSSIYSITQLLRLLPLAIDYNLQIDCVGVSVGNPDGGKPTLVAGNYLQEIYDAIVAIQRMNTKFFEGQ
ncbi:MAG: hypothetical protein EOM18_00670 [Clostridia bacterium]|nr:hypothetical protein [Clostridia bacterium]